MGFECMDFEWHNNSNSDPIGMLSFPMLPDLSWYDDISPALSCEVGPPPPPLYVAATNLTMASQGSIVTVGGNRETREVHNEVHCLQ